MSRIKELVPAPPEVAPYLFDNVRLVRVVDGDTALFTFPLPFNVSRELDVRLIGINTPELHGPNRAEAMLASAFLYDLLTSAERIMAQTYKTDRYGRYLAQVWIWRGAEWINVSSALLGAGHAVAFNP